MTMVDCPATPEAPCFCGCHKRDMTMQYAVLCPADGKVRSVSSTDFEQARSWASSRDADCGKCHPEDGTHVVVSRFVSAWTPDTADQFVSPYPCPEDEHVAIDEDGFCRGCGEQT